MTDRRLAARFRSERRHGQLSQHVAPPKTDKFTGADAVHSGDSFSVDLAELQQALRDMADLSVQFDEHVRSAAALPEQIPTGVGPVGDAVGIRFNHRLGEQGGIQQAINTMIRQIDLLVNNIRDTTDHYTQADQGAADFIAAALHRKDGAI